jgi:hypothetical protein
MSAALPLRGFDVWGLRALVGRRYHPVGLCYVISRFAEQRRREFRVCRLPSEAKKRRRLTDEIVPADRRVPPPTTRHKTQK